MTNHRLSPALSHETSVRCRPARPRSHQHGRCITDTREKPARRKNDVARRRYCYRQRTSPGSISARYDRTTSRKTQISDQRHTTEAACPPPSDGTSCLVQPKVGVTDHHQNLEGSQHASHDKRPDRAGRSCEPTTTTHAVQRTTAPPVAGPRGPTPSAPLRRLGQTSTTLTNETSRPRSSGGSVGSWLVSRGTFAVPELPRKRDKEHIARVFTRIARVVSVATEDTSSPSGEATDEVERRLNGFESAGADHCVETSPALLETRCKTTLTQARRDTSAVERPNRTRQPQPVKLLTRFAADNLGRTVHVATHCPTIPWTIVARHPAHPPPLNAIGGPKTTSHLVRSWTYEFDTSAHPEGRTGTPTARRIAEARRTR